MSLHKNAHRGINIFGGGTVSDFDRDNISASDVGVYAQIREHKIGTFMRWISAIHPYYGLFYSRDKTYSLMGFDKVEDSMDYTERKSLHY